MTFQQRNENKNSKTKKKKNIEWYFNKNELYEFEEPLSGIYLYKIPI